MGDLDRESMAGSRADPSTRGCTGHYRSLPSSVRRRLDLALVSTPSETAARFRQSPADSGYKAGKGTEISAACHLLQRAGCSPGRPEQTIDSGSEARAPDSRCMALGCCGCFEFSTD